MTFAPAGLTDDKEIKTATSLVDYIFKRLAHTYLSFEDLLELGLASIDDLPQEQTSLLTGEPSDNQPADVPRVGAGKESTVTSEDTVVEKGTSKLSAKANYTLDDNAPMCYNCGNQTQRSGSCYVCTACGSTTGCS